MYINQNGDTPDVTWQEIHVSIHAMVYVLENQLGRSDLTAEARTIASSLANGARATAARFDRRFGPPETAAIRMYLIQEAGWSVELAHQVVKTRD